MSLEVKKYKPFFYKNPNKKRNIKDSKKIRDKLSFIIFNKINENDCFYKYNERIEKIKILEKLEPIKIKNKLKLINNLNDNNLDLQTLNFICFILKLNIIWYNDKCFVKMTYDNNEPLYLFNSDTFTEPINLDNKYEINDINKPLKCISYYKLNELKEIYNKLNLLSYVKLKKDYYQVIFNYHTMIKLI